MEWSYYNFLFKSDRFGCYLLYNSLSNVFIMLNDIQYHKVMDIKRNSDILIEDLDLKKTLIDNRILVNSNQEEYYKLKLAKMIKRYDKTFLSLTIAPTSDCNFRCPYCFENEPDPLYMTESIQKDLISFIRCHVEVRKLFITWYGGEPLLAFDRIRSITNEIELMDLKFGADIVTNGYYLEETVINQLDNLHIRFVHVTLDGLHDVHNKRRLEKRGKDSFDKIIRNISLMNEINPSSKLIIRVNIDKENIEEYHELYFFLFKNFPNAVLNVYPGFVKKSYGLCAYSERNLLSNEEQAQFVLSQYKNYHIMDNTHFLPTTSYTECLARCLNGFLVSPDGYLYKCWTDLGNKEESVGHISNEEYRIDNLSKYMVGGDPFSDEKCRKCKFLPICGGGCPHMRLKNIFKDAKIDLCHISKNHIHEFLELYYERYIENRN